MKTNFNKKSPKKFLGYLMAIALVFMSFGASAQCDTVSLNLVDSFGDGWNGGVITVDGADYTLDGVNDNGATASFVLCLDLTPCTELVYAAGSSSYENSWSVTDAAGVIIASGNDNSGTLGNCVPGCTDPAATNHDATATVDDGSCIYLCLLDEVTLTLSDSWGDGWSGETVTIGGVDYTLSSGSAISFDLCVDLSTCIDVIFTGGNAYSSECGWDISDANGTALAGSAGDGEYFGVEASDGQIGTCAVSGCTDATMFNYDPVATIDDGSCVAIALGCTDVVATNYDAAANTDDGSCTYCTDNAVVITVGGGTDASEVSWSLLASDGSVVATGGAPFSGNFCLVDDCYTVDMVDSWGDGWGGNIFDMTMGGASMGTATLDDGAAGTADISLGGVACPVYGCTDAAASNHDATATVDDGSCIYPCLLDAVTLTLSDSWGDGWSGETVTIGGVDYTLSSGSAISFDLCVDLSTCIDVIFTGGNSYSSECGWDISDANGTALAGSAGDGYSFGVEASDGQIGNCFVQVDGCTDSLAMNYDALANTDDGSCTYCVDGCMDDTQFNYDANATCDDGSCIPYTYGCTDASASNYNSTLNTDDGSCIWLGCTDDTADNYDATATVNDGSCTYTAVSGCTDPAADNYDATATVDDGSCTYPTVCAKPVPTGLYVDNIIQVRAMIHWDNMSNANTNCMVLKYYIQSRPVGTTAWATKFIQDAGLCNQGISVHAKNITQLIPSTTYEYRMKAAYCGVSGQSAWSAISTFTTADECPNVTNFTATPGPQTSKVVFSWDTVSAYSMVRIKLRVDSISNPTGSDWQMAGGFGVNYPATTIAKWGVVAGETYRGQARTWCDPAGGLYRSPSWTSLIWWTQPTSNRVEGGTAIANLDVYPNPSRDVFNVAFTSEDVQNLEIRVINIVGEVVYTENLEQFVGEYTKSLDLATYTKGVYFLEITTNNGVVNKKLILQ
jgi:hypothetical protein